MAISFFCESVNIPIFPFFLKIKRNGIEISEAYNCRIEIEDFTVVGFVSGIPFNVINGLSNSY